MRLKHLAIVLALAAAATSCRAPKTVLPYFTDITEISEGSLPKMEFMPEIKPDDELFISVTSANPEATALYNVPFSNPASRDELIRTTNPRTLTYVVDSEGDIYFPLIGKMHVAGLTTEQLQKQLTELISKDVEDPYVTVRMVNFKVVVAGEVRNPHTVNVSRNRYSILDALSDAGDLTEYGERANVLLIREEAGERKYIHLDLNSSEVLTSPYFYLQQNDYIYVAPNKIRQANSKYNQNNAFKLSVTSTIVSAASVIASLVIALTVKN